MRFVIFTHSLVSDWNHGNAHFLRGVAAEILARGDDVRILEPRNGWSLQHLLADAGDQAVADFARAYPRLGSTPYDSESLDLDAALDDADVAIVHEWNPHELVARVGAYRTRHPSLRLFFHDTHHRSVTDPESMAAYDLRHYDGVLAYGSTIRDLYRQRGWSKQAWTWHEAADCRMFYPREGDTEGDLVWIGNWGDGERSRELREFLIRPVVELGLKAKVYGVRYPDYALKELAEAGIEYGGWLPNYRVPETFARYRLTVHIPRGPYARALPGIPTIRPFEALACGIPLVSAPWQDTEGLFRYGRDFLMAADGDEMVAQIRRVLADADLSRELVQSGLESIRSRHTCSHRVDQLRDIVSAVGTFPASEGAS